MKKKLSEEVWAQNKYYDFVKDIELKSTQPGMKWLLKYSKAAKRILDLGCGEGTRLNHITKSHQKGVGLDISKTAINRAKKKYPKLTFVKNDLEKLPFKDNSYDLVYSFYVLEHLDKPEKVLKEATRVLSKEGKMVLVAPNYGAPNRASPPSTENRLSKLFSGFIGDILILVSQENILAWKKVTPIATKQKYEIDWDTTVEPYVSTLIMYLKSLGFSIKCYSTCYDQELPNAKLHQKLFKILSYIGLYPFTRWGPVFYVVAEK